MSWNYRIGRKTLKCKIDLSNDYYEEDCFGIVECYYNEEGEIYATTERFIELWEENLEDLKWSFEKIKEAFDKEVLDLDNIDYVKPY